MGWARAVPPSKPVVHVRYVPHFGPKLDMALELASRDPYSPNRPFHTVYRKRKVGPVPEPTSQQTRPFAGAGFAVVAATSW